RRRAHRTSSRQADPPSPYTSHPGVTAGATCAPYFTSVFNDASSMLERRTLRSVQANRRCAIGLSWQDSDILPASGGSPMNVRALSFLPVVLAALLLIAFLERVPAPRAQTRRVDDATLKAAVARGDEWLTYGFTQSETRFSPL